jgi:high-affinity iron transporter
VAGAFFIFLREGVEASLIVSILLAYLSQLDRRDLNRYVYAGVSVALGLAAITGALVYATVHSYTGTRGQTIFETSTFLLAAAVLTYMTLWLTRHAKSLSMELRQKVNRAIDGKQKFALAFLAFQAVGREGLETMVFTLALVFAQGSKGVLFGGVIGLTGSLMIAYLMCILGRRINLAKFFRYMGIVLTIFAAGLIADAVENLQQLGWLPFSGAVLWNSGSVLSENSTLGDILHSFVGYAQAPTLLQVGIYVAYLAIILVLFVRASRPQQRPLRAVSNS